MIDVFIAVGQQVTIGVAVERVGFTQVEVAVLVGILDTVFDAVAVGVIIQRIGVNARIVAAVTVRFHHIGDAVRIAVAVRIKRVCIEVVQHPVVVIVVVGGIGKAIAVKVAIWQGVVRAAVIQRIAFTGIYHTILIGILNTIIQAIAIGIFNQGVGLICVNHTVLVGILSSVFDAVIIGVVIQWIGICTDVVLAVAPGFHIVGQSVAIAVAVRIIGIGIVQVSHAVVIIVGIRRIPDSIAIEIAFSGSDVRHTGIVVIGVIFGMCHRIIAVEEVPVGIHFEAGCHTWDGITGIQWVRIGCRVVNPVVTGFIIVGNAVAIAVAGGVVIFYVEFVVNSVVVIIRVFAVDEAIAVKIAGWEYGLRVAGVQGVGFTCIQLAVLVGVFFTIQQAIAIGVGHQRVGFQQAFFTVLVQVFHTVFDAVVVGIGIQRVGVHAGIVAAVVAGFQAVNEAVGIRVAQRVVGVNIKLITDPVTIVVVVIGVDEAIAIEIALRRSR